MAIVEVNGIKYDNAPSVASIWAIDYEPYYCNICGEFAGYRPNDKKFTGVCSFQCAEKYLKLLLAIRENKEGEQMKEVICAGCGQYESECRCEGRPMGDRIEEVKKILIKLLADCRQGLTNFSRQRVNADAKEICQLFPQPLDDKELREKIAKLLAFQTLGGGDLETQESIWEWVVKAGFADEYYDKADQIPALLQPKIEEARRQERERIHAELSSFVSMLKSAPEMHGDIQADIPKTYDFLKWWQDLKGGE